MAQTVYSVQLAAQLAYHGTLLVLVPAGYKLVVRDIDANFNNLGFQQNICLIGNIGQVLWKGTMNAGAFGSLQWQGRQVFEPGQSFSIQCNPLSGGSLAAVDFQVSGYKLLLP